MKFCIAIPTLNEAGHICRVVKALSEPVLDGRPPPIWVVDGGSSDGTVQLVLELGLSHVSIIQNPVRVQSHAMNLAALRAVAQGMDVMIRADAHAIYRPGFCRVLLDAMTATDADAVVVPLIAVGGSRVQDAQAILQGIWLGIGGARHRVRGRGGFVEHGHHAAIRLPAYLTVGGYDSSLPACEDVELDYRLVRAGKRIFMEDLAAVDYLPRSSLLGAFAQHRRNGDARMKHVIKHGAGIRLRQLLLFPLFPALVSSFILGVTLSGYFLALPVGYLLAVFALSLAGACNAERPGLAGLIATLALTCHLAYSCGMWGRFLGVLLRPWRLFRRDDRGGYLRLAERLLTGG